MFVEDLPTERSKKYIKLLHRRIFGEKMKSDTDLNWVQRHISQIADFINTVRNPAKKSKYISAVTAVLQLFNKQREMKVTPRSLVALAKEAPALAPDSPQKITTV